MSIERAGPADAELMAAIHAAAFSSGESWGIDVFRLQLALQGVQGLLHPDGGLVLLRVAADEAEILTLAVIPTLRRHGVGSALLYAAIETVRIAGVHALFLEVSVVNQPARALYARAGFAEVGRRPRYYADGTDALVLRLDC
ncbi:MAG: hypothetical protein B7Z80_22465 [Rhodospirillales bacterium 20-64-7]|nr:MAG: hypothetical protein B7Z80_22465 [Rhodospirillales bacterium 20-64-7]HQT77976.1 GNAT family N-acetyltransferase [Rhodopila sp.]